MTSPGGTDWIEIAAATDIPDGAARTFTVESSRIAVTRVQGRLYAVQDLCTHDGGPLASGQLDGFEIQCPRHGARFDVRDGSVRRMPAIDPIATYAVKETDGKIFVAVAPSASGDDW